MMAQHTPASVKMLGELVQDLASIGPLVTLPVYSICTNSQQVLPGTLFLACSGANTHGLIHIEQALDKGAVAVIWEGPVEAAVLTEARSACARSAIPLIELPELSAYCGVIAARFYDHPSANMKVIGVTGTNGKSSCTHYLAQALDACARPCGLIGTLGVGRLGDLQQGTHTTPDALHMQSSIARLAGQGVTHLAVEASSHGLQQGRLNGVAIDVAIWTNLSRDHLDFHGDMQRYAQAKRRLFERFAIQHALLNADDAEGVALAGTLQASIHRVLFSVGGVEAIPLGLRQHDYVVAQAVQYLPNGMCIQIRSSWGAGEISTGLFGAFNVSNILASLAGLLVLEVPFAQALASIAKVTAVAGRMECFSGSSSAPRVIVDYAHTPDALGQALQALRAHFAGKLWCVFGCGGDRDQGKRPIMGEIAARLADQVIVTDDNPRQEDGAQIVAQILAGMPTSTNVQVQRDRGLAITQAITQADASDVVLVAGKGHESVQWVADTALVFSDRAQVRLALRGAGND